MAFFYGRFPISLYLYSLQGESLFPMAYFGPAKRMITNLNDIIMSVNSMKKLWVCMMILLSMPFVTAQADNSFVVEEINQSEQFVTITGTGVRMRFGPGLNYGYYKNANGTTMSPKKGTKLQLLGQTGDWYEVKYGNDVAYVFKQYAKLSGTTAAPAPVRSKVLVTGTGVRLRKGPGLKYDYLKWQDGTIRGPKKGDKLICTGETTDWYKVQFANSEYYLFKQYAKKVQ